MVEVSAGLVRDQALEHIGESGRYRVMTQEVVRVLRYIGQNGGASRVSFERSAGGTHDHKQHHEQPAKVVEADRVAASCHVVCPLICWACGIEPRNGLGWL
jgi:hypothetical protein